MNPRCEEAELYAAGVLPASDAAAFEEHLRACDDCPQRLADAFEAIATIESARPLAAPPPSLHRRLRATLSPTPRAARGPHWYAFAPAAAAAVAIALVPTWVAVDRSRTLQNAMLQDQQALARIAMAPTVEHAEFMAGTHPMGKVLYGARGDWYYIVVMHPTRDMQVAYIHGGRRELLGRVAPHGISGTLYLPVNHQMNELALLDGGRIVADAHLAYKGS